MSKLLKTCNLAVMPKSGTGAPLDGGHVSMRGLGSWPDFTLLGRYLCLQIFSCSGASRDSLLPPVPQGLKQHTGMVGR